MTKLLVGLLVLQFGASVGCTKDISAESRIQKLTGVLAVNCGERDAEGLSEATLGEDLNCAKQALGQGRGFYSIERIRVSYGQWFMGLAGNKNGKTYFFSYRCDQKDCSKSFSYAPCPNPSPIFTGMGWKSPNEVEGAFWTCDHRLGIFLLRE